MNRETVIARLKALEHDLRSVGVAALYLYGSYAWDEAKPDSDLDMLADFEDGRGHGLSEFMAPYHVLAASFPGTDVGYGTREGLHPLYRPHIEPTLTRVF
jgi:hypothetical protein